jgi:hypothetical protein
MRWLQVFFYNALVTNLLLRILTVPVFFNGEGSRSRCYGRTTALSLFVQPYDKNKDEDEQF